MIFSMSRLRLIVCISLLAWLLTPIISPVAQTNRTTKTTNRDAAKSQNAELKSLYEAHQWFKLRDAVQAKRASAFYRGAVAAVFNDVRQAEKNLKSVITSAPRSEGASAARALLIYVYQRSGRYRQALSMVEEALAVESDNVLSYIEDGQLERRIKLYILLIQVLEELEPARTRTYPIAKEYFGLRMRREGNMRLV